MKIRVIIVIFVTIVISAVSFSEIIILKNGKELKGKIIKTDEDTMTILTKTEEIVINKDDVANIYYDEIKYDEDKNKKNSIPEKNKITGTHIISSVPENGAINILHSQTKTITIKFNEAMNKDLSYECSEEINKPKWLDPQTLQIELKEFLDHGKIFKLVLNPSGKKQIMQTKLKTLLPPDTIFSFTSKEAKWTPLYYDDFNRADTENGNIGPDWIVDNKNGSATVKIENNELKISQMIKQKKEPEPIVMLSREILIGNKDGMKIKIKFKNQFLALTLIGNNESYGFYTVNDALYLNHYTKKYSKNTTCELSSNTYYIAEIIREKNLLLCEVKNEKKTYIKKLSFEIPEDVLPSSIKLFIDAGGDKYPFIYVDDLEVSVY